MKIKHQNTIQFDRWQWHDVLRPIDYSSLPQTRRFSEGSYVLSGSSSRLRLLTLNGRYEWGTRLNYIPPAGQAPGLATFTVATGGVSVRMSRGLTVDNSYLFDRNLSEATGRAMYNSHILRSKWNWQLNRELSVRFIAQYNALLTNPQLTSAVTGRRFNADFLIAYVLHPGTAIYVGYNTNLSRPGPPVGVREMTVL